MFRSSFWARINFRSKKLFFVPSLAVLFLTMIFSLFIGPVNIPINIIMLSVLKQLGFSWIQVPGTAYYIVVVLREPEIIGAMAVGISLSVGGASMQSVFRNPITDPYVTGISSGAALGAVIAIVTGLGFLGIYSISIMAFIFAILVVMLVYTISMKNGRTPPTFLLLSGIAVSIFISSLVALLLYSRPTTLNEVFFWLLGSVQGISWSEDSIVLPVILACTVIMYMMSGELNALQMGESHARSVGIDVERSKAIILAVTTLSVAVAVSVSGIIGFIGLIFPHVSRLMFGGSNKYVIPSSAIFGATFLVACNDIAHVIVWGEVVPIGIITGLIGVPFFIALMMKMYRGSYYDS